MRRNFFIFFLLAITSATVFAQADKADEYLQLHANSAKKVNVQKHFRYLKKQLKQNLHLLRRITNLVGATTKCSNMKKHCRF